MMSSSSESPERSKSCMLCIENYTPRWNPFRFFTISSSPSSHLETHLPCCNQSICCSCFYLHIKSIIEEGMTGQGRKSMMCPFGCGAEIHDIAIRTSFHVYHLNTPTITSTSTNINSSITSTDGNQNQRSRIQKVAAIIRLFFTRFRIFLGKSLYYTVTSLSWIIYYNTFMLCSCCCFKNNNKDSNKDSNTDSNNQNSIHSHRSRFNHWMNQYNTTKLKLRSILIKTSSELQDLEMYFRWSLTIALSSLATSSTITTTATLAATAANNSSSGDYKTFDDISKDQQQNLDSNAMYIHVTRCPAPNCDCLWLTNKVFHDQKVQNEKKYNNNSTYKILKSATTFLFYKPVHPSEEEQIMDKNGYTTEHWLQPHDLQFLNGKHTTTNHGETLNRRAVIDRSKDTNISQDGRVVSCPTCDLNFCALCAKPWYTLHKKSGRRISHTGMLCSAYNNKSISDDGDFLSAANMVDARLCPGCSMRTDRTDGCNHMTCPCGYEWCYVCEYRWDRRHYGCTDSSPLISQSSNDKSCVIS
mmetsp:Transcript_22041/g.25496  ORF Transcript_22041/g.25496 Transcript_22041/m.25496 type:complete len:528 (-) Transcript_22041:223-1806(-)